VNGERVDLLEARVKRERVAPLEALAPRLLRRLREERA
jgi:hypothetical protein